jgi:hypothetical protein
VSPDLPHYYGYVDIASLSPSSGMLID